MAQNRKQALLLAAGAAFCLATPILALGITGMMRDGTHEGISSDTDMVEPCNAAIRARLQHPSTYRPNWFAAGGNGVHQFEGGGQTMVIPFRAKNSYGLELDMEAVCHLAADGSVRANIRETL